MLSKKQETFLGERKVLRLFAIKIIKNSPNQQPTRVFAAISLHYSRG
jgi:hypothetical protein